MTLPYIPFANCAEVVVSGNVASQLNILTFGVRKGDAFVAGDLDTIATAFEDWIHTELFPLLSSATTIDTIKVTDLTTVSSPVLVHSITSPIVGGGSANAVPSNMAVVVSFATPNRGRSFRGRNYVFGVPLSTLSNQDTVATTAISAFNAAYAALATTYLGAVGFDHVVLSRFNDKTRRTTGVATRVNAYITRAPIGTQRRRVQGRGA